MVRIKDIAERTNLSQCTVSRILNGKHEIGRINIETCKKVISTAQEMGYRPNAIARLTKTGQSNTLGVLGIFDHQYHLQIINGIAEEVAQKKMMFNLLLPARLKDESLKIREEAYQSAARTCVEQRVAGIIVCGSLENELNAVRKEAENYKIPIVVTDSSFPHNWCSRVVSDDVSGAQLATEHLISQGKDRIAHITSDLNFGYVSDRFSGYTQALKKNYLELNPDLIFHNEKLELKTIANFLKQHKPDAVFCATDYYAAITIQAAILIGLRIPEELSIFGYGNLEIAKYTSPPLSSVDQPFEDIGKLAVKLIYKHIKDKETKPSEHKLQVKLILRESTEGSLNL